MEIKTVKWNGYSIRFVEYQGDWWAFIDDVEEALKSKVFRHEFGPRYINETEIDGEPVELVNEIGIYQIAKWGRSPLALRFESWGLEVMSKLRRNQGFQPYEVFNMFNLETQQAIDHMLDSLYFDEETGTVMQSVTVAGGDVEQIPFE